jgi:hypothetical protein
MSCLSTLKFVLIVLQHLSTLQPKLPAIHTYTGSSTSTFIYSTTIATHYPPQYRAIHTYTYSLRHVRMGACNTLVRVIGMFICQEERAN